MEKSQFIFCICVALGLLLIGGVLFTKALVGLSLMLLGILVMAVATITRSLSKDREANCDMIHAAIERG